MRKNGSRLISFRRYKFTDMFLFAVILTAAELIIHFAFISMRGDFIFSPMLPIVLLVIMRWGWPGAVYAAADGALYCLLNSFGWEQYLIYVVGNACISVLLLMTKFVGKQRIAGKWYFSLLFVLCGWLATDLGKSLLALALGYRFLSVFINPVELFSVGIAIAIILVMRRLDGMFEDQKHYLKRLDDERKEIARRDEFGDEPVEIDEETVSILRKHDDDLYK